MYKIFLTKNKRYWKQTKFYYLWLKVLLNIIDDFNLVVHTVEADTFLTVMRVIRVLDQLSQTKGRPQMIRVDNGLEFNSFKLVHYCRQNNITLVFIQPGKPTQNAFIERCNGNIRKELLSAYVFQSLSEVRIKVKEWMTAFSQISRMLPQIIKPISNHWISTFNW